MLPPVLRIDGRIAPDQVACQIRDPRHLRDLELRCCRLCLKGVEHVIQRGGMKSVSCSQTLKAHLKRTKLFLELLDHTVPTTHHQALRPVYRRDTQRIAKGRSAEQCVGLLL